MRLTSASQVTFTNPAAHPLAFTCARGERFQVSVLADDLIRIEHFPDGKPRVTRRVDAPGDTWMDTDGRTHIVNCPITD